jgi:chemotaxis protein CheD
MKTTEPLLPLIHLKPGELVFTEKPAQVVTVLGSCVTITMFSAWPRCAAICHAMLSKPPVQEPGKKIPGRFKYLSEAIPFMAAHFRKLGINLQTVEVKMFGGGNVTPHDRAKERSHLLIGNANIQTARQLLATEALNLKAANVGGLLGRKLIFNTQTGKVMHKHLPHISTTNPRESK